MKLIVRSFLPGIIALVVATILFCMPGQEFPQQDWYEMVFLDKWVHIGLFVTMVMLWSLPFIPRQNDHAVLKRTFLIIAIAHIMYGIGIEFIQDRFITNRTFGIDDMVADAIGSGIGLWLANWQRRKQVA